MSSLSNFFLLLLSSFTKQADDSFHKYYVPSWGLDHFSANPQGTEVQLKLVDFSGAGFRSKEDYGSGLFHIRMKIPEDKSGGVITTFYLTSLLKNQVPGNHFELDFEFWGENAQLTTNVFVNDSGHREQRFRLWFDPSKGFHNYDILWNSHQIVFLVDSIPVRVFKNNMAQGVSYPTTAMHIEASIWNASWAGRIDWSQAPFISYYQDFGFDACLAPEGNLAKCASEQYFWNRQNYWELNATQKLKMEHIRRKYMTYDYCSSNSTKKKECLLNP